MYTRVNVRDGRTVVEKGSSTPLCILGSRLRHVNDKVCGEEGDISKWKKNPRVLIQVMNTFLRPEPLFN